MESDGSAEERLTTVERVDDDFPAWSPDGRTIAFSRGNGEGPEELWVIDLAMRGERMLTAQGLMDYSPSWSPDGRLVAFRRSYGHPPGVYIASVDGGEPWLVTPRR
jgi:TolB protein